MKAKSQTIEIVAPVYEDRYFLELDLDELIVIRTLLYDVDNTKLNDNIKKRFGSDHPNWIWGYPVDDSRRNLYTIYDPINHLVKGHLV